MPRRLAILLLLASFAVAAGCRGTGLPEIFPTGDKKQWMEQQRKQAERYDPYPDNSLGPVVEGVRPRGFEQPWPEPAASRYVYPNGPPPRQ